MKTLYGYLCILIILLSINLWATAGALAALVLLVFSYLWNRFVKQLFKKPNH